MEIAPLLNSYVRKIDQLQDELDAVLAQRDRARRQRNRCMSGWREAEQERRALEAELDAEISEWNEKVDLL